MSDQPKTAEATASANSTSGTPPNVKKDVLLSVDPERATFLPTGSRSEHMIVNLGENRWPSRCVHFLPFHPTLGLHVRCSDNAFYCVNPVYMLVDQGQRREAKIDKFVLNYVPCNKKKDDASRARREMTPNSRSFNG
ncbi:Major sperm protein [Aphelenchoides fujianensis]|nr:Major sperm protein [Aphelenchoides fujianensis]